MRVLNPVSPQSKTIYQTHIPLTLFAHFPLVKRERPFYFHAKILG